MATQPTPISGASLSDLLTAAKNIVIAINALAQDYLNVQGIANAYALTTSTLVKGEPGRVATVVVLVAGSGPGVIYDTISTATTKPIYNIPTTAGVYFVNMPCSYGITVVPGTGQTVTVSYS